MARGPRPTMKLGCICLNQDFSYQEVQINAEYAFGIRRGWKPLPQRARLESAPTEVLLPQRARIRTVESRIF